VTCDPDSGECTRAHFKTENVIPEGEIDPIGQAVINLYPEPNVPDAVFPEPNFRQVALSNFSAWQFDIKLDHQFSQNHKVNGRYSRHHDLFTTPTVLGNDGDGVIYKTDVHNVGLEYDWAIRPTMLLSSRLSLDRVVAPGISNNYPTLESVGFPSVLAGNGLHRMPTFITSGESLNLFDQCCVDTNFAHTLWTYSSALQLVIGRHAIKFGGEQRQFFNKLVQRPDPSTAQPVDTNGDGVPDALRATQFFTTDQNVIDIGGNALSAIANADAQIATPALKLIFATALGNFNLTSFVEALQQVNLADLQAEPLISTSDNSPAEILVGEKLGRGGS